MYTQREKIIQEEYKIKQMTHDINIDIKDVVLDWDGTLVDSGESRVIEGYRNGLKKFNVVLTPNEDFRMYKASGKRIFDVVTSPFVHGACKDGKMIEYVRENKDKVRSEIEDSIIEKSIECFEFQGFRELRDISKKHGINLHIYTMKWTKLMEKEVERRGYSDVFESVNGSTATLQKSDKDAISKQIPQLNPKTTIFIGDGRQDYEASQNFGCWFFQIGYERFGDYKKVRQFKNLARAVGAVQVIKARSVSCQR